MATVKKVWTDPLGSKLIAEGIKKIVRWAWGILIIPLYAIISAFISKKTLLESFNQTWMFITDFFFKGFKVNFFTILIVILSYLLLTWLIKRLSDYSITSYKTDNFWGAIIHWKWKKEEGEWRIKRKDYKLICPDCFHNLRPNDINGQHHLSCQNISCNFRSGVYYFEPPSNVIIIADMNSYYFHRALSSMVDAELRRKGVKK